ncbi:MAG: multicopper oxidase domain-containing protein [Anaerolineaceae bacterium]|nr:multicopper oxidase domain-containing protein [Anaerolineaceae bacterium]
MRNTKSFKRTAGVAFIAGLALLFSILGVSISTASPVSAANDVIQGTIWVANENGNSITVIDASTNQVITTLTGIEGPHNLQVSPDGKTVWAVSGHDSTALLIDATTYSLLGTVPTGDHPAHIIVNPEGNYAYVTNGNDNTVTVIDAAAMKTIATIPVGEFPHGLRPSPDGRWVYVANVNSSTLSVIDTATNNKVADIEVGQRPVQVAFSPDNKFVYFSLNGENALGKIDAATRKLVGKVDVGVGPVQVFVTPDNRFVVVANQGTESIPSTTISIVDTTTFSVVRTIETGKGAHGVVIEPSGHYAYITNIYGNNAAVVDLTTQQVTTTVPTGLGPNGISFSPLAAATASAPEIALAIPQPSESTDAHAGHHPTAETTATPVPNTSADTGMGQMGSMDMNTMMQNMSSMMDTMLSMPMSDEMRTQMKQMRSMMDMMMSGNTMSGMDMNTMMQNMNSMMDTMLSMNMSDEMRAQMKQMRSMMDMMMSGSTMSGMDMTSATATPAPMGGMDMGGGHSMEAISSKNVPPATQSVGGQPLDYQLKDGVKIFSLTAEPVIWKILDGVSVTAWTYNGTVPGPMIRVTEGDRVRINFTNNLPEPTTIHWHGINVPNAMDGVPGVTQEAIQPGATFTYEFTAGPVGTFMYHSHYDSDVQVGLGLYAPFIIDPKQPTAPAPDVDATLMLSEWRVINGQTFPAMPMSGAEPNYFTINGHAFPSTDTINVKVGQRVHLRLVGIGQFIHPMHLHGMPFEVVAIDGYPVPEGARQTRDTLSVAPGERYDIEFVATEPGTWLFHCHILHHVTNDGVEPGGLAMVINVTK